MRAIPLATTSGTTSGTGWSGTVTDYASLPPAASHTGEVYLVQTSTGFLWNRRKGLYESDGVSWNRLSNATFQVLDTESVWYDDADNTKSFRFELSGITTATQRILSIPDKSGVICTLPTRRAVTGTSTSAVIGDANNQVSMDNSATNTFNLVNNATVPFAVDDAINIIALGTGLTVIQAPAGVDLNGVDGDSVSISAQYRTITVQQIAIDSWIAYGAL